MADDSAVVAARKRLAEVEADALALRLALGEAAKNAENSFAAEIPPNISAPILTGDKLSLANAVAGTPMEPRHFNRKIDQKAAVKALSRCNEKLAALNPDVFVSTATTPVTRSSTRPSAITVYGGKADAVETSEQLKQAKEEYKLIIPLAAAAENLVTALFTEGAEIADGDIATLALLVRDASALVVRAHLCRRAALQSAALVARASADVRARARAEFVDQEAGRLTSVELARRREMLSVFADEAALHSVVNASASTPAPALAAQHLRSRNRNRGRGPSNTATAVGGTATPHTQSAARSRAAASAPARPAAGTRSNSRPARCQAQPTNASTTPARDAGGRP